MGRDEAELAGLRRRAGGHAAQVLAFVGAAVEGFEVGAVGGARAVEEGHVRVPGSQLFEGVGIAEGGADDDVGAALDQPVHCRADR